MAVELMGLVDGEVGSGGHGGMRWWRLVRRWVSPMSIFLVFVMMVVCLRT